MNTKCAILFYFLIASCFSYSQNDQSFTKGVMGKTNFLISYYHAGGYNEKRPFFFLDQIIEYRFHKNISVGAGIGINLFPGAIGTPITANGRYHFTIRKIKLNFEQSIGMYVILNDYGFSSNRYVGAVNADMKISKNIYLNPQVGYLILWDKYGGRALSLFAGLGLTYPIWKQN